MNFDKRILNTEAKKYNFAANTYEKVIRLTEILDFIHQTPFLRENLALKGGTAINLTIFDLPRLSVDIDLDFTTNVNRDQMINVRKKIDELLIDYMIKNNYSLDNHSRYHHALDGYKFYYTNAAGNKDVIKIEINYMLRAHIYEPIIIETKPLGLIRGINIRTLHPYEIFGSKLVALMTRTTPRDLYDFYNMIKYNLFNADEFKYIKKCAIYYRAISNEDGSFDFDLSNLSSISQRDIKKFLYPVIKSNERFNLDEAINVINETFNEHFIPSDRELHFLDQFKNKKYRPELLFDQQDIVDRIKSHPMAIWKTRKKDREHSR